MNKLFFFLGFVFTGFAQTPELIFNSGFGPGTSISPVTTTTSDLLGTDNALPSRNNWKTHLDGHPNIGYSVIQFDDADNTARGASLVNDPTNPQNQVIQFWSKTPNLANTYGRIQGCIYANNNLTNVLSSVRMYLPSDINILKQMTGTFDWFTIMEFWNAPNWINDPYPFRVSLNIRKLNATSGTLNMRAYGQRFDTATNAWVYIWDNTNATFALPTEKWFTLETHIIEGDASNGKFRLVLTPDGEPSVVLFDITNYTRHPNDPNPNGIDYINPFKLYAAANLVNYVTANNGVFNVLYDDFKIWKNVAIPTLKTTNIAVEMDKGFLFWDDFTQSIKYKKPIQATYSFINCKLFDMSGKLQYAIDKSTTDDFSIPKGTIVSGNYVYQINSNGKMSNGKIFVP